jgi:adenylate kinase
LIDRLSKRGETSGRADDQNLEKIRIRINVYEQETLPVAEYYKNQKKLRSIQGLGEIEEIFLRLTQILDH